MMDNNVNFDWGDIITITLKSGDSFTILIEQTGRLSGKNCPISELSGLVSDEVVNIRFSNPSEIKEFMRGLFEEGRLLHQGFDTINKPSHYADSKIECIDAMEAAFGVEAVMHFCLCNSFKYIFRSKKKNGTEDIKKAMWYENKYLELEKKLREDAA
jgi:hypothetical protein